MNLALVLGILSHLSELTGVVSKLQAFIGDLKALATDTSVAKIIAADPALATEVATVSQLWRTEEGDVSAAETDKNFFSKLHALEQAGVDGKKLVSAMGAFVHSPAVTQFLATEEASALPAVKDLEGAYASLQTSLKDIFGLNLPAL